MFPPVSDGPGQQDPAAAAKAPLPPLGRTPRGGSSPSRGDFLKNMVSGLAPVERGVAMIHHGIDMIQSAGLVDPQILTQFRAFAGALIPLSVQQLAVPGGAPQQGAPPTMGQGGIPPAGGMGGPPTPAGPPPGGPGPGQGMVQ